MVYIAAKLHSLYREGLCVRMVHGKPRSYLNLNLATEHTLKT